MSDDLWNASSDGVLTSETSDLRLMVEKLYQGARFLVFQKTRLSDGTSLLVASGIERTPRDAMKKAISTSARFRLGEPSSEDGSAVSGDTATGGTIASNRSRTASRAGN